jgi:glycosyltransferase involved in cell wall biosynthesis
MGDSAPGSGGRSSPRVVMVLENCPYPLDARVRLEAESLVEAGFTVEVLAPREADRPVHEMINGVRVTRYRLPDGNGKLLGTALEYAAAFCLVNAAVLLRLTRSRRGTLHVHNPPDLFFPLFFLARRRGWSTVFDHHDDAAGMLRAKLGRPTALERLLAWMRNQSARASDLTIVTNETQRELVEAAARDVVVVRNGAPLWFGEQRPSPPTGRARLVFLGEIGVQDGVERAVDVLSLLVDKRRLDVELLIIGDGPQRRAVEERARALGVDDRLTVTGWVPYEQVPALLASAHVGLDTAPLSEVNHGSTMVKIAEYLAVGLPVVASGLRETQLTGGPAVIAVSDGRVESFVEPVAGLLVDPVRWRAAADLARERGHDLQWPAQAANLVESYSRLTGS